MGSEAPSNLIEDLEDLIKDPSVDVALSPVFFAVKRELKRKDAEIERLRKALGEVLREVAPYHPSWRIWDRVRSALTASETERTG